MPSNLTLRISAVGQVIVSRNRRLSKPWRWGWTLVMALVMATTGVILTSLFWAYADFQNLTLSYQISQAQETQKQLLDMNNKLRIELANLKGISRLEKLAEEYGMGAPLPHQVVKLP
jgi:cell division protein FtsL